MSIAKKILSLILSITLVMGVAALSVCAVGTEPSAGVQATTSQWWEGLPDWIQGILRWLFFGWIWMKPITPLVQPLNPESVASNLIRAIETTDLGLFEEQLCLNIKQTVDGLPGKITELFDAIDGELVDYSWRTMGGYEGSRSNGKSIKQKILIIDFTATAGDYTMMGNLEYYNSFQPAEMGMRSVVLFDESSSTTPIAQIRTTEGENGWHE